MAIYAGIGTSNNSLVKDVFRLFAVRWLSAINVHSIFVSRVLTMQVKL